MVSVHSHRRARALAGLVLTGLVVLIPSCREQDSPSAPRRPSAGNGPRLTGSPTIPTQKFVGFSIHTGNTAAHSAMQNLGVKYARTAALWWIYKNDGGASIIDELDHMPGDSIFASVGYAFDAANGFPRPTTPSAVWDHCGDVTDGRKQNGCIPKSIAGDTNWTHFLNEWKAFVGTIVAANHNRITFWGAWNEPNGGPDRAWFIGADEQYDTLAKALCDTVHQYQGLTCVGPEIGIEQSGGVVLQDDLNWLTARLQFPGNGYDIVSAHIYAPWSEFLPAAQSVRNTISAVPGKSSMKLWITETGHISPAIVSDQAHDPELQEQGVYDKLYNWKHQTNPVDGLFYFDLYSKSAGMFNEVFDDAHKRPAYWAFKQINNPPSGVTYAPPTSGQCSADSVGHLQACPFGANAPDDYQGQIHVRVVDQETQPVAGVKVVGYWGGGAVGIKPTDASGNVTFRVWSRPGSYEHGVFLHEYINAGVNMPWWTNHAGQQATNLYDGIFAGANQHRYRLFVVVRNCTLTASASHSGGVDPSVGVNVYTGAGVLGTPYTDGNGMVSYGVDCFGEYGLSTGINIWPNSSLRLTNSPSGDPYYGWCDGLRWSVDPVWAESSNINPAPYITKPQTCQFIFNF